MTDQAQPIDLKIREIIGNRIGKPAEMIEADLPLSTLGVESLDIVEIIFAIEEAFDIEIPFNANSDIANLDTVNDIVRSVQAIKHAD